LTDTGELIGSLPVLLGFHPTDSLVVVAFNPNTGQLIMAGRTDLADLLVGPTLAARLADPLPRRESLAVVLIVIAEGDGPVLPYREMIGGCVATFRMGQIDILDVVWATATTAGAPWRRYVGSDFGTVPNPEVNTLAAYAALSGRVIFANREEMAEALAPDPEHLLKRRASLLSRLAAERELHCADPYLRYSLLDRSIREAQDGHLPTTDEQAMCLVLALRDRDVRDACFQYTDGPFREGAERLWRYLLGVTPGPDRAEPAILLAITAYLRADTVTAGMALECARTADPKHRLTELLGEVIEVGLPTAVLRRTLNGAFVAALDHVMATSPESREARGVE
jgi:hypothetical protein